MTSDSAMNRRSFLARSAAIATAPAVATVAGGAFADPASADTLPDYAPVPPSALGPAVNARGYHVGRVEKNLCPARRDVRDPPHAPRRRGADRPGVARRQPHAGQHL